MSVLKNRLLMASALVAVAVAGPAFAQSGEVKLGFLLRMMKPTIEKHIHDNLDEIFAAHTKPKAKKA